MKRNFAVKVITLCVVMAGLFTVDTNAQSNWEAGIRFGQDFAIDATIPLSARPRLHASAYFGNNGMPMDSNFGVAALFDWLFALDGGPTGLKFYPGVGPEMYFGNDFNIGVAGDFGVEYSFDFPLTIGFDWRPGVFFTNDVGFRSNNWGFTARFRFGEGVGFTPAK